MMDLLLPVFLLAALSSRRESVARRPAEVFAPTPTDSGAKPPPGGGGGQGPEPGFPKEVVVPEPTDPTQPRAGYLKVVEVWQVRPDLASGPLLKSPDTGISATLRILESQFPTGWVAAKTVTPDEVASARALLREWRRGGVIFAGPGTLAERRAYRMTEHQKALPAPAPAPAPGEPGSRLPEPPPAPPVPVPAPDPGPPTTPQRPSAQVTTVRKGEGLSQIAKRLGRPENQQSAQDLRSANVPDGPDAKWKSIPFAQGGLRKVGRNGGLQPGDRLFVPAAWGPIDAARL